MRRIHPPPNPTEALRQFESMQKAAMGLKLLLPYLPPGASLEEARRLHRKLAQKGRPPCSFLEAP